jgi:hypothetical protein
MDRASTLTYIHWLIIYREEKLVILSKRDVNIVQDYQTLISSKIDQDYFLLHICLHVCYFWAEVNLKY